MGVSTKLDILEYIPQRPPFVFVEELLYASPEQVRTAYCIREDNPLVINGVLPIAGLMEHAAQTCAVRAGWVQHEQKQTIRIGYIGAIKHMQATRLPHIGERLETEAKVVQEVANISLLDCNTYVGDELICQTTIKLALVDE